MKCQIVFNCVPAGPPYYANGPMTTVCQCQTHGIVLEGPAGEGTLCSIGKIEKAVDDGLAKIAAALAATP